MRKRLLFLGTHGVWGTPLYGAQLRSERIASGLADAFDVTYACMGAAPEAAEHESWMTCRKVAELVVGETFAAHSARWGGPVDVLRALAPHQVPIDIRERVTADFVRRLAPLAQRADAVWAHRSWMAEAARRAGARRIVCDVDDFEGVLMRQYRERLKTRRAPLFRLLDRRLVRYEARLYERFARVVVTKEEDLRLVDRRGASQCHVVPNGFDLPAIVPSPRPEQKVLLFVGTLHYPPNIHAILWFLSEVLPRIRVAHPDARFLVVGKGPLPPELGILRNHPLADVEVSPTSLASAYGRARVVVAPVRLGHGTRIKALEAIAYRRPLVATSECLRGHPIIDGRHAWVAESATEFAAACIRLLDDEVMANQLAQEGRQLAERLGGWAHSIKCAQGILETMDQSVQRGSKQFCRIPPR